MTLICVRFSRSFCRGPIAGSALGLTHQGHLVQKEMPVANVWKTVVDRVGLKMPENFQGGLATGVVKELI